MNTTVTHIICPVCRKHVIIEIQDNDTHATCPECRGRLRPDTVDACEIPASINNAYLYWVPIRWVMGELCPCSLDQIVRVMEKNPHFGRKLPIGTPNDVWHFNVYHREKIAKYVINSDIYKLPVKDLTRLLSEPIPEMFRGVEKHPAGDTPAAAAIYKKFLGKGPYFCRGFIPDNPHGWIARVVSGQPRNHNGPDGAEAWRCLACGQDHIA